MESEGVRLRIYVNKRKKMILAPEVFEKYGGVSNETIQIKNGEFTKEIEREVNEAMQEIIERWQPIFDNIPTEALFAERQRQVNLLAVDHNARQNAFISNDKAAFDSKQTRKLNEAYLQMFVDMYGKQFTVADLKTADVETLNVLDKLYVDALGRGENNEEEDTEKKE